MIPADFVQALLQRIDIVDVIDAHIPLKKSGSNYVACCPFHHEKTPSFSVSQTKQFYHCFGCAAHGNAIGFVMAHSGLSFVEAVKELAQDVGLTVPEQTSHPRPQRDQAEAQDLSELLAIAMRYYREELKRSEVAIGYLKKRGLSGQVAARFGIGYAPSDWQNLAQIFPDYKAKTLVTAGLVIEGEGGKRYDRFRDRIMFPILNQRGNVIGFGGRVLGQGEPKYLNSPETPVFEKGRELYGVPQAMKAIREAKRALVVEGYMDVVALAQHGIEYGVATLGTATSAVHVQRLLRFTDQIVFCFDGDAAGRRAAWRALEMSLGFLSDGKQVSFLFLPQGEDPDSFVRTNGRAGFEALLGTATPLSGYLVSELTATCDLKTEEGRAALLQRSKPLLKQVVGPALSLMLRKRLAELTGITREELDRLFEIHSRPTRMAQVMGNRPQRLSTALQLAAQILLSPALAQEFDLDLSRCVESEHKFLRTLVELCRERPQLQTVVRIQEHFRGSEHESLVARALSEVLWKTQALNPAELETEFRDGLMTLAKELQREDVSALIQRAKTEGLTDDLKRALRKPASARKEKASR